MAGSEHLTEKHLIHELEVMNKELHDLNIALEQLQDIEETALQTLIKSVRDFDEHLTNELERIRISPK